MTKFIYFGLGIALAIGLLDLWLALKTKRRHKAERKTLTPGEWVIDPAKAYPGHVPPRPLPERAPLPEFPGAHVTPFVQNRPEFPPGLEAVIDKSFDDFYARYEAESQGTDYPVVRDDDGRLVTDIEEKIEILKRRGLPGYSQHR